MSLGSVRICTRCLLPSSKPDLSFTDSGLCSACVNMDRRKEIDWEARDKEFRAILEAQPGPFHCIVASSGGKDSHAIALKVREMGFTPFTVTATTCSLSPLGRRNLDNLRRLGFQGAEITTDTYQRHRLNKFCLEKLGDISWPEHVTIFTIPFHAAKWMGIKVVLYGECPQNEYGGPPDAVWARTLDATWLHEFGGLLGLRPGDLEEFSHGTELYRYPDAASEIMGLFLGYYYPWNGYHNALLAQKHGFEFSKEPVETHGFHYENLDNYQTGIHDYFKYLKFGFSRAVDICSIRIRHGQMDRIDALAHVLRWDGQYPRSYLGKPTREILEEISPELAGILYPAQLYWDICDKFRNQSVIGAVREAYEKELA